MDIAKTMAEAGKEVLGALDKRIADVTAWLHATSFAPHTRSAGSPSAACYRARSEMLPKNFLVMLPYSLVSI
jgi:hypothetical protein